MYNLQNFQDVAPAFALTCIFSASGPANRWIAFVILWPGAGSRGGRGNSLLHFCLEGCGAGDAIKLRVEGSAFETRRSVIHSRTFDVALSAGDQLKLKIQRRSETTILQAPFERGSHRGALVLRHLRGHHVNATR